ncbi:MAG: hypothetical protein AAF844_04480 [Pseudomonadota bacterium]
MTARTTPTASHNWIRRARLWLGSDASRLPRFTAHRQMADRSVMLVKVFYVIALFKLYDDAGVYHRFGGDFADQVLLWPLWWTALTDTAIAKQMLSWLALVAGVAGAFAWRWRASRLLVSLALLQAVTFANMGGSINHGQHEIFWVSVMFWFLPTGSPSTMLNNRFWRVRFIMTFAAAGGLILFFYTLSGYFKVEHAFGQLFKGEVGGFHPDGMATILARRMMDSNTTPLLAELIIENPLLGWPMFLVVYYVELFAIVALFRPELVRLFGGILMLFHLGTFIFMEIIFIDHVLINGLLFWLAPWAVARPSVKEVLLALPLIGFWLRPLLRMRGADGAGDASPTRAAA